MAETKSNERAADGGEMGVLSEGGHVPSLSARAKTAFSVSIVPHSFETFTEYKQRKTSVGHPEVVNTPQHNVRGAFVAGMRMHAGTARDSPTVD